MDGNGGHRSSKHSINANDQELQEADVWEAMPVMHHHHHHFEPARSSSLKMKKSKSAASSSSMRSGSAQHHRQRQGGQLDQSSDPMPTPAGCFLNGGGEEQVVEGDTNEDEEMIPPHEWIARRLARSHISSSSVCEGAGRTLKGRDLSRVRNAVLAKTGFLEPQ